MGTLTGAEIIRGAASLFGNCRETWLDRFTADELVWIYLAWRESDDARTPDDWEPEVLAHDVRAVKAGAK